ncbi:uncharacterized protein T069G_10320 [Trichoderma breve]|uniref:Cell wall protein n=1 Tax=Trichoderma breve TaxID=2034170 RepID=A0A9W9B3H4_9HYPO|nr:uncharacterized protein T069G_10320 [Trichoderma breve]KAJ4854762.1 hypothetical protein T069G_10320 [Trichoderma breve]
MKFQSTSAAAALLLGQAFGYPLPSSNLLRREVPQEHSHDLFLSITNEALAKNNPKGITDAVFGLLGNAAAAGGAGSVTNLDCLKQETADQAFTNGKAAKDIRLMAGALVYQALERNTGKVGLASVTCTEQAVNPEIEAVKPHQDPASANAASINKGITLELAKQLKAIGADPNLALLSGTFAPGDLNDATAKGNTCDDTDPQLGCIFTTGKLVLDASQDEVASAVSAVSQTFTGTGGGAAAPTDNSNAATTTQAVAQATPPPAAQASSTQAAAATQTEAASSGSAPSTASGNNVQTFTGSLGGPPPPVVSGTGNRPFSVNGNTFVNIGAALGRSCDIQHNACADAANSGQLSGGIGQCDDQNTQCKAAASGASNTNASNTSNTSNGGANNSASGNNADNGNAGNGNAGSSAATGDFGSCSDPSIKFANGLDGRTEPAFAPVNEADFNHGSALAIKVISDFICDRLNSSCKASAAVVSTCQSASAAASQLTGQAAADAFNKALGV